MKQWEEQYKTKYIGNNQIIETGETSIPVGTTSTIEPRQDGHNLPMDEETIGYNRRKGSIYRNWHWKHHKFLHPRENVDFVKHHNFDYRHPESTTELDRVSAPTSHYNRIHCGSICAETTNHPTTQSIKTNHKRSNHLRQCSVEYLPCFFGTKKDFVLGGDVGGTSWWAD